MESLLLICLFMALIIFLSSTKHLLVTLLCLEFLVLLLFGVLCYSSCLTYLNSFTYLTLSVCESALGLSLLVTLVRSSGSDRVSMLDG
nr:NADH dehydrogenase subunit 4L [Drepanosurus hatanakai]BCW86848.1 NADH dehydrogenase subunit 4L [Drepanosurus hatanakai]